MKAEILAQIEAAQGRMIDAQYALEDAQGKLTAVWSAVNALPEREPAPEPAPVLNYRPILNPDTGLQPAYFDALGHRWSSATASEVHNDMPHCFQIDEAMRALKFELQFTDLDFSSDGRRRAEISTIEKPEHQVLNGQTVWNSWLFRMLPWADPEAMAAELGSSALSISQMKPNSGGSPTRCHRLTRDGFFQATTTDPKSTNVKRYTGSKRMDDGLPHRIVESITPHPTGGRWILWLDGVKLFDFSGPMGANTDGYSPSFGIYSAGGIGCDISIEYLVEGLLSKEPLDHLVNAPMVFPA